MLLQNDLGQMATVALSMHSKQPKRAMISLEKGYIEIMEYPRADKAFIVDAAAGDRREICAGQAANALYYEMKDRKMPSFPGMTASCALPSLKMSWIS